MMPSCQIIQGDALTRLREMPAESVQCCVTSPPYWGLRDYGMSGQVGIESSPTEFVASLVAIFQEVKRVLKPDGVIWVNLGDSYAGSGRGGYVGSKSTLEGSTEGQDQSRIARGSQLRAGLHSNAVEAGSIGRAWVPAPDGFKQKDLIGIPWRVAFALQDAGWYLRSDIIWAKPNPMPESVTDRPTRSHEYIFLLSKSPRYYYDSEAIKEPCAESSDVRYAQDIDGQNGSARANGGQKTNGMMKAVGGPLSKLPHGSIEARKQRANPDAKSTPSAEVNGIRADKQRGHGRRHEGFNGRWDDMERTEQCSGMRNKRDVWTVAPANYSGAHFATYPPLLIQPRRPGPHGGLLFLSTSRAFNALQRSRK